MAISDYTRKFQVKYDKKVFRGKKACCEYYNIGYRSVSKYISQTQCSFPEAVDHYRKLNNKKFYYRGRNWKSFRECCSFFHINYNSIMSYIYTNACSKEKALAHYIKVVKKKHFTYDGVRYDSFPECCRSLNFSPEAVRTYSYNHNYSRRAGLENYIVLQNNRRVYQTLIEQCKRYNINSSLVIGYAKRNKMPYDAALKSYILKINHSLLNTKKDSIGEKYITTRSFDFKGSIFPSFTACCTNYDISPATVRTMSYNRQISLSEALERCLQLREKRKFIYDGVEYKSFKACCLAYKLNYNSVTSYKTEKKCDDLEAFLHFLNPANIYEFRWNGVIYRSLQACCAEHNISYRAVSTYRHTHKCTKEEAFYHYCYPETKTYIRDNVVYESFADCCKKNNISYSSVRSYMHIHKCSREKAFQYYLDRNNSLKFVWEGITYRTFRECCQKLGISFNSIRSYKQRKKCCNEDALKHFLKK